MSPNLSPEQLKELHQKLLDLKRELAKVLSGVNQAAKPVKVEEPIGRISRIDALQDQSLAKATRDNLLLKSRQVEASLDDFTHNRYGLCRLCNQPIGYPRLSAKPEAPFCLSCQTKNEKLNQL